MAYKVENWPETVADDSITLHMASAFSPATTVIDSNGQHYSFRKFQWMNRWGICNGERTKIIVKAKNKYEYAKICTSPPLLIVGSKKHGWDIYSVTGELLECFTAMPLAKVTKLIG